MRPAQGKQEKRKKPKWRWLDVHAMHIADVAQERRKNAKMTVSVCSRYALCVIVKCFAMQLWTVLGGIWIYMTSTGTGRKKVIINVWSQKSGNFLQTFEPDSYLIIAISKFVLHSGKKYKTLAKNKQNKNWQNYWWVRLWYFWQNEKKRRQNANCNHTKWLTALLVRAGLASSMANTSNSSWPQFVLYVS